MGRDPAFSLRGGRRAVAVALCFALLGPSLVGAADGSAPRPSSFSTEVIGGRTWIYDAQVTSNAVDDDEPQLTVDADHSLQFLWRKATGGNGSLYYAELDEQANLVQNETFITSNITALAPIGEPRGDFAGLDSSHRIHVTGEAGPNDVTHAKFEANGSELVAANVVGPLDGQGSRAPAIAIGLDDTVHIAHSEYKFQCEDIAYDKLSNNGSDIWIDRVVSSDIGSLTENGIIRATPYDGNFLFTFGSDQGSWLGRFDKFGVKDMASVKFRNQTDGKPADVAGAPNGSMHLVWEDGGRLLYTMVNATGVKVVDANVLEASSNVGAFPRLAVASDGTVIVVWEDNRTGASQIMFGEIPRDGNLGAWVPFALTQSSGAAFDPVVAVDADDGWVVAWTDTRDGDREIFTKRSFGCSMELYGDPFELGGMDFLHPNETKVIPLKLRNKGLLADSFAIDLTYTPGAFALGWRVSLNATYVDSLGPGQKANLSLTIQAPANAQDNDYISVGLNATSLTWPDCFDRVDMTVYVKVTRGLRLSSNLASQNASNGETIGFAMVATNTGDLREDPIDIIAGGSMAPDGWVVSTDKATLSLDPGESTDFTAFVSVPNETWMAHGNMSAHIGVTIRSAADSSVEDTIELTVQVRMELFLELSADPPHQIAIPGQSVVFRLNVSNVGNLLGQVETKLDVQQPATPGWQALLDRDGVYLAGGQSAAARMTVMVPSNAMAGTSVSFDILAFAPRWNLSANTTVFVTVAETCGITVQKLAGPSTPATGPATIQFNVVNTGNAPRLVNTTALDLAPGWSVAFRIGDIQSLSFELPAFGNATVTARISFPQGTLAGPHPVSFRFEPRGCSAYDGQVIVEVPPYYDVVVAASPAEAAVSVGGVISFDLAFTNRGNAQDYISVAAVALPSGFTARFVRILPNGGGEVSGDITSPLLVGVGATVGVRLSLTAPAETNLHSFTFDVLAGSESGNSQALALNVKVVRSDPAITQVEFNPAIPRPGFVSTASVAVSNLGEAASVAGAVRFFVDGSLVDEQPVEPIAAGSMAVVSFLWAPPAGSHELRFVFEPLSTVTELSLDNNAIVLQGNYANLPASPVPSDPTMALSVVFVVGAAALFVALTLRRRNRP